MQNGLLYEKILSLTIRCCARNTISSNSNNPKIKSAVFESRRLRWFNFLSENEERWLTFHQVIEHRKSHGLYLSSVSTPHINQVRSGVLHRAKSSKSAYEMTYCSPEVSCSLRHYIELSNAAFLPIEARGVVGRERVGTAFSHFLGFGMLSHTFFIVTWLEDVYFYSDFLFIAPDVAYE